MGIIIKFRTHKTHNHISEQMVNGRTVQWKSDRTFRVLVPCVFEFQHFKTTDKHETQKFLGQTETMI